MKAWNNYTDKDNVDFAKGEYGTFDVGDPYKIGKGKDKRTVGYVRGEVGYRRTDGEPHGFNEGEQAFIVSQEDTSVPKDQVKHVAVVYRGSDTSIKSPLDTFSDWAINDIPAGTMAITNGARKSNKVGTIPAITPQQIASINTINQVEKEYPNADIYIYGQSLGSMDGQFAVAGMNHPERLKRACLYEGPNMYNNLNPRQKKQADKLTKEGKIQNFVDEKDIIGFGYSSGSNAIGNVCHIKSEGYHGLFGQHMWGGYKFDEQGHIKTEELSDGLKLAFSEINVDYKKAYDYAAKGGLSDSEKIMLDAAAGRAILQSLSSQVDAKIAELRHEIHQEMDKCDEEWKNCIKNAQMVGKNLSKEEVIEALSAGGCTKELVVNQPKEKYREYLSQLSDVEDSLNQWLNKMDQAVAKIEGTDNKIAGYFN